MLLAAHVGNGIGNHRPGPLNRAALVLRQYTLASTHNAVAPGTPRESCISWRPAVPGRSIVVRGAPTAAAPEAASTSAPAVPVSTPTGARFRFVGKLGSQVLATVTPGAAGAVAVALYVQLGEDLVGRSDAPQLHWGMYRSSMSRWHHPKDAVPPGSVLDAGTDGMRTPLAWDAAAGAWVAAFTIPAKLQPLHLAMVLHHGDVKVLEGPARGKYFSVPVGMTAGDAGPLGALQVSCTGAPTAVSSINFAVFARHASAMSVGLVRVEAPAPGATGPLKGVGYMEVALDPATNRTGDVWHICLSGLKNLETLCYAWRADGDMTGPNGGRYHSAFLLLDPYASRAAPVVLPEAALKAAPKLPPKGSEDAASPVLLASLSVFTPQPFDWGDGRRRPSRSLERSVMMQLDVESFTSGPAAEADGVPPERRGKLLGLLDRIDSIKASGATAVMLSPLALWGTLHGARHPLSLLAPDGRLAVDGPLAMSHEIKRTVKALHEAGLEVLMQAEFSVTAEGADASAGRLQGLRGLDAAVYYRNIGDITVLNGGHPVVRQLILAGLRHWAMTYQLDGFCITGAENLAQDSSGRVQDNPALAEEIAQDPLLRGLKLVAAVDASMTSLLPRGGVRGFPHWGIWLQCNNHFAAAAAAYLRRNESGGLSDMATRIAGSADLFAGKWDAGLPGSLAAARRPSFCVNLAATLGDRSLAQELEAEDDTPGRAEVLARTLLLLQFTSLGTPCFSAATADDAGSRCFVAALGVLRDRHRALLAPAAYESPRDLQWLTSDGGPIDWSGTSTMFPSNVLTYCSTSSPVPRAVPLADSAALSSEAAVTPVGNDTAVAAATAAAPETPLQSVYVALNPYGDSVSLALPAPPAGTTWRRMLDSSLPPPQDVLLEGKALPADSDYVLAPWAGLVLEAAGSEL